MSFPNFAIGFAFFNMSPERGVPGFVKYALFSFTDLRFVKEELINRAMTANEDIKNGKVFSQEEAEKLSKTW